MKILVVGSGAREHALVWKIAQSSLVRKIYCAPGNGGIASLAECVPLKSDDIAGLLDFAQHRLVDLTVVGPEIPLASGIVDAFEHAGLKIFGPRLKAARLEASKYFAKEIMVRFGVPTADFAVCRATSEVLAKAKSWEFPVVLKADGLAAGKGVVICSSETELEKASRGILEEKIFGASGESVVVEEFLKGEEASILVLTDGKSVVPLASSQDHKRIFDRDQGPNTGGMGAYSPAPVITDKLMAEILSRVIKPVVDGMAAEGMTYKGILYAGVMLTAKGPKVLEFNVRFGDPETQAVLVRLKSDIVEAMLWSIEGGPAPSLEWDQRPSVCVVMASGGYPGDYRKGQAITGLEEAAGVPDVVVFHAGTEISDHGLVTSGGRVLGVTALGDNLESACGRAYEAVEKIHYEGAHFRKDIGWRALKK
ncbi:MAG: phosphoribosylamine--glycine ligase [Candidatus Omnitrophota bacterium]